MMLMASNLTNGHFLVHSSCLLKVEETSLNQYILQFPSLSLSHTHRVFCTPSLHITLTLLLKAFSNLKKKTYYTYK